MQSKYVPSVNGVQVQIADLQTIANSASAADDAALQEVMRLPPYTGGAIARGVQAGVGGSLLTPATGGVYVNPAKYYLGSRSADPADIRSTTNHTQFFVALANTNAYICIALIYARLTIDTSLSSTVRKVKSVVDLSVTTQNVSSALGCKVDILSTQSTQTAGGHPLLPGETLSGSAGLPADDLVNNIFYIPLAYVNMPATSGVGTVYSAASIAEVAPRVGIGSQIAACNSVITIPPGSPTAACLNAMHTTSPFFWTSASSYTAKTPQFVPAGTGGGGTLQLYLDLTTGNTSILTGAVVDGSIDWRNRFFRAVVYASGTDDITKPAAWSLTPAATTPTDTVPQRGTYPLTTGTDSLTFMTHTMGDSIAGQRRVCHLIHSTFFNWDVANAGVIGDLYVDSTTGELKFAWSGGNPQTSLFFWIDYSGQLSQRA